MGKRIFRNSELVMLDTSKTFGPFPLLNFLLAMVGLELCFSQPKPAQQLRSLPGSLVFPGPLSCNIFSRTRIDVQCHRPKDIVAD